MSSLRLELVLDVDQAGQILLAKRLRQRLDPGEHLRIIPWTSWTPGPCRSPGAGGDAPISLLLTPARWRRSQHGSDALPKEVIVLVELCDGAAHELGATTAMAPPLRGDPASRFCICRFAGGPRGGLSGLVQLAVPGLAGWQQHRERCQEVLADYLLWWLRLCQQRQKLVMVDPIPQPLPLRQGPVRPYVPRLQTALRWAIDRGLRACKQSFEGPPADWQIAMARIDETGQRVQLLHHLPPCQDDWFADPFLLAQESTLWLFCERWDAAAGKGVIDLFEVQDGGLRPCGTVIEESFHLSFPRVVQHGGVWFATVESGSVGEVRLYRAETFPNRWRFERVLLAGHAWIDPILIPATDGWWLLVNSHHCPSLPAYMTPELQLFHSPDLLRGPFQPHPCTPVLVDSTCGRNGGLLRMDGGLIRVGQCIGINNVYGENVRLRRLDRLDHETVQETPIELPWLPGLRRQLAASRLHTLNNVDQWLALDYRPRQRRQWRWPWCSASG